MPQRVGFGDDNLIRYFTCGAAANLNITTAMSMDCWIIFKNTGVSGVTRRWIFDRSTGGVGGYNFGIQTFASPGRYTITWTKTALVNFDSTVEIQEGRLTHIAVVWDGVNSVHFYRDGVLIQTINNANALLSAPAAVAYVGIPIASTKLINAAHTLNIYNRALSTPEILYNKEHPNNPIRRGLQLGLTQENFVGGVWKDISANAYDATPGGSPLFMYPCNNIAGRNVSL